MAKLEGSRQQQQPASSPAQDLGELSFTADRSIEPGVGTEPALSSVLYHVVNTELGRKTPFQAGPSISNSVDGEGLGMSGDRILAVDGITRFGGGRLTVVQSLPTETEISTARDGEQATVLVLGPNGPSRVHLN
ncbi:MAG: hypothetical protein EBZ48_07115 [Proteobacteria bacterium]|nr:hypothetical protein [Pseudomonadota bacterium]